MKKEMEEIIRENYGDIYKYCFRHLNRKGEAEDMKAQRAAGQGGRRG